MVLFECILLNKCRLCHDKLGHIDIKYDEKFIKEIYECIRIKVNDKLAEYLPHKICEECQKNIKTLFLYRQRIQKVNQCLMKLVKNIQKTEQLEPFTREEKDLLCLGCNENFKNEKEFADHHCQCKNTTKEPEQSRKSVEDPSKTDSAKSKFVCSHVHCKEILVSAFALKRHLSKHGVGPFLCVACGKRFRTKNSLRCHEKIHLEIKGYECKLCNIGFSVRSNLRAHERKHHEGIRFYCSQCPKKFLSKNSLDRHERTHTGIKEFQCEMCPSAFYTHKELVKHQKYHQGLRLFKCERCYKTFFDRHHLTIHLRIHTGERPYVCKVSGCGKSFMESQKLKRHNNAKHAQH